MPVFEGGLRYDEPMAPIGRAQFPRPEADDLARWEFFGNRTYISK
jgi:hypothetical protein